MPAMHVLAIAAAAVAGLIHVYFFAMESLWFMRPAIYGRFGLESHDEAAVVKSWAYNQGFYNLFLAAGVAIGIALAGAGYVDAGRAVTLFACGSMIAAGVVLYTTNRRFLRAAAIQAVPPILAVLAILFLG
jgi:putative membrane protein